MQTSPTYINSTFFQTHLTSLESYQEMEFLNVTHTPWTNANDQRYFYFSRCCISLLGAQKSFIRCYNSLSPYDMIYVNLLHYPISRIVSIDQESVLDQTSHRFYYGWTLNRWYISTQESIWSIENVCSVGWQSHLNTTLILMTCLTKTKIDRNS